MNRYLSILFCIIFFNGCSKCNEDSVYQVSIIDALLAGNYTGYYTCNDLLKHGDFGLGTFNALDGEMLVIDGEIFQVRGDGSINQIADKLTTPFSVVKFFSSDVELPVTNINFEEFERYLDQEFPDHSLFYAIRVKGVFAWINTRSFYPQTPPYQPLVEIPMQKFSTTNVEGTLIGFRCPSFVKGLNVPGYHFHFLSDNCQFGGHVLDFYLKQGEINVDESREVKLFLPDDQGELSALELKDRTEELNKVER